MKASCPPDDLLNQFLDDHLDVEMETALEVHVRACCPCQLRLERLTKPTLSTCWVDSPPSLPPQLSRRLEESLSGSLEEAGRESEPPPEAPGYDVFEEIGRGGSGVVYRALQQTLNRPVALKVLHERTSAAQQARLRREAAALASIRDAAIVEIYEIGEVGGRSFLALEYVPSGSLSRYIAATPQLPLPSARLVAQLAGAIHRAHQAGFVHRDLKPGNILLDRHYGIAETSGLDQFVPKISDFGVVKIVSTEERLTQTREFLGTPSYMAPEQAYETGDSIDCRTDVYGLGAILYELLTGRPPFRSASPLDTLLQVKNDDPIPPRRLEPKVPRDLETICLKCLEKEPDRRYATAEALEEDLRRFLEGRPVVARPLSGLSRGWRWCRRNRGWAAMIAVTVGMLVVAAIAGPLIANRERQLRKEAADHEATALREKGKARDHLDLASKALEETLGQVLVNARLLESGLEDVRSNILRTAMPYLEQFVQREESDDLLRVRQGWALLQLANLHAKNGQADRARTAHQQGLAIFMALRERGSPVAGLESGLASAHMEYGRFLVVTDHNVPAATDHLREALRLEEKRQRSNPDDAKTVDRLAIILSLLGYVLAEEEPSRDEARSLLTRAVELREQLLRAYPLRRHYSHYAALTHLNLALFHRRDKKFQEAFVEYDRAQVLERKVLGSGEVSLEAPLTLSNIEGDYATALAELREYDQAWTHLDEAIRYADALVRTNPAVVKYVEHARKWHDAALVLANQEQDREKALARCRAAIALFQQLSEATAENTPATECWLAARLNLADVLTHGGQLAEATRECEAAGNSLQSLLDPTAALERQRGPAVRLCIRMGWQYEQLAKPNEALRWYDTAAKSVEKFEHRDRGALLAQAYHGRARCLTRLGKMTEATAAVKAAQSIPQQQAPSEK